VTDVWAWVSTGKLLTTYTDTNMGGKSSISTTSTTSRHALVLTAAHLSLADLLTPEGITGSAVHLLLNLSTETLCHYTLITGATKAKVTLSVARMMSANECLVTHITTQWDGVGTLSALGGKWELAAGA